MIERDKGDKMKKGKKLQIIHGLAGTLMLCLVLSAIPATVFAQSKSNQKYDLIIRTERDFINFMKSLDKGTTYDGKVVKLAKDIKINAKSVNDFKLVDHEKIFSGVFDGGCHTISDIQTWVTYNEEGFGSLFGTISSTGIVKNLYIDNFDYKNKGDISILATYNYGVIDNCRITNCCNMLNSEAVYPFSFKNCGVIKNCICGGDLKSGHSNAFVCDNNGFISNCGFFGKLNNANSSVIAGLVHENGTSGKIENSYCILENENFTDETYGICYYNKGILSNCYSSDEGVEYAYGIDEGVVDNVNTYSREEMRSSAFVKRMNSKLSSGFLKWTLNSSSEYPSLVDMNEVTFKSIDSKKGYVKSNKSYASEGQKVTLTPVMNKKYKVTSISVKTTDGKNISAKKNSKGAYVFTMPNDTVVVSAKIVKAK